MTQARTPRAGWRGRSASSGGGSWARRAGRPTPCGRSCCTGGRRRGGSGYIICSCFVCVRFRVVWCGVVNEYGSSHNNCPTKLGRAPDDDAAEAPAAGDDVEGRGGGGERGREAAAAEGEVRPVRLVLVFWCVWFWVDRSLSLCTTRAHTARPLKSMVALTRVCM